MKPKKIEPFVFKLEAFLDSAKPRAQIRIESDNAATSLALAAQCLHKLESYGLTVHVYIMPESENAES